MEFLYVLTLILAITPIILLGFISKLKSKIKSLESIIGNLKLELSDTQVKFFIGSKGLLANYELTHTDPKTGTKTSFSVDYEIEIVDISENCTAAGRVELGGTAKLSRNYFKKIEDGKFVNMITYRNSMTSNTKFKDEVRQIENSLKHLANNFEYEKVEIEYAIYDTNVTHDSTWLKN
jgi:Sec-independent protein translocase protein TatA